MEQLIGPSTGSPAVDLATRELALDLFVNPAGVSMLARLTLASAHDRPDSPSPINSTRLILDAVLDPNLRIQLVWAAVSIDPVRQQVRLFPTWRIGPVLFDHSLEKIYGDRAALDALGRLILFDEKMAVFTKREDRHLHIHEMRSGFIGDPILNHYFDASFLALMIVYQLVDDVFNDTDQLYPDGSVVLATFATTIAQHLCKGPGVRYDVIVQAARALEENRSSRAKMKEALRMLFHPMVEEKRMIGTAVLHYIRTQLMERKS